MSAPPVGEGAGPSSEERVVGWAPEAGIGLPIAVGTFGFSVLMLGIPNAALVTPDAAEIFVPVALGTGAFGLLIGGLLEYRANNIFGGSFALFYSAFLLTTGLMLLFFAGRITETAGAEGFREAFGAWLLLWCVFTIMLAWAAWFINMPAFLAFALLAVGYLLFGIANVSDSAGAQQGFARAGGWVLIGDGLVAWYLSWALAVNPVIGDKLPLWPHPYSKRA